MTKCHTLVSQWGVIWIVDKSTMANPDCPRWTIHYKKRRGGEHSLDPHEADRRCSQVSEFTLKHCLGFCLMTMNVELAVAWFPKSPSCRMRTYGAIRWFRTMTYYNWKHGTAGKTRCSNRNCRYVRKASLPDILVWHLELRWPTPGIRPVGPLHS